MSEIYLFKITKADVQKTDGGARVRLWYPTNPEPINKRLSADPEFGIQVFEKFLREGYAEMATPKHPIRPPSAGSVYLFEDDAILVHRRDAEAPVHPLYHSIACGFPKDKQDISTENGLIQCGLRESAEENLLITKDRMPKLLVPKDSIDHTRESAKRFGIDKLKEMKIDADILDPPDILEVYTEGDELLFSARAFLDFGYESEVSLNALQVRYVKNFKSHEVLPIDTEYKVGENGRLVFLNRESYLLNLSQIINKKFGDKLRYPMVYRTKWKEVDDLSVPYPKFQTKGNYKPPYFGPDKTHADHPHIFAPDNLLTRIFDGLNMPEFKGRWAELQLEKEKKSVDNRW